MKVLQSGFCWPSLFKDALTMCKNIMPLNPILIIDLFDVWALTSWDLFLCPLATPTSWWQWTMFLNELKRSRANAMITKLFSNFSKRTSSLDLEYPRL
ncbi:hypothetical protein CK203_002403 [Vitis vinifera]|uniref:Integrase zinc-binding domain-containing protein n=1 Tax=Vitis vinifera TaxID=29760 RepID=A0A438KI87_VITVI|nr:hypothetical protein CK203_002403 [Vitis vinifera]